MKAKNISGRLARILAMLLAMILITGCMAIPVAIGEENTTDQLEESTATYSILVIGSDNLHSTMATYQLNDEESDRIVLVSKYYERFHEEIPEGSTVVYFIFEDGGATLIGESYAPNIAFYLNPCVASEGSDIKNETSYWGSKFIDHLIQGTELNIYLHSTDARSSEVTRATVDYLINNFLDKDLNGYSLKETSENVYVFYDGEEEKGTLRIVDLDELDIEFTEEYEPWNYVYDDMVVRLRIVEPEPDETETETAEPTE